MQGARRGRRGGAVPGGPSVGPWGGAWPRLPAPPHVRGAEPEPSRAEAPPPLPARGLGRPAGRRQLRGRPGSRLCPRSPEISRTPDRSSGGIGRRLCLAGCFLPRLFLPSGVASSPRSGLLSDPEGSFSVTVQRAWSVRQVLRALCFLSWCCLRRIVALCSRGPWDRKLVTTEMLVRCCP